MSAPASPAAFDVVAVGASAGGVIALTRLLGELPEDLPVPVLVVQHLDPRHQTVIAEVLQRRCALVVKLAETVSGSPPAPSTSRPRTGTCWCAAAACWR